jgi:hypothetical protein
MTVDLLCFKQVARGRHRFCWSASEDTCANHISANEQGPARSVHCSCHMVCTYMMLQCSLCCCVWHAFCSTQHPMPCTAAAWCGVHSGCTPAVARHTCEVQPGLVHLAAQLASYCGSASSGKQQLGMHSAACPQAACWQCSAGCQATRRAQLQQGSGQFHVPGGWHQLLFQDCAFIS